MKILFYVELQNYHIILTCGQRNVFSEEHYLMLHDELDPSLLHPPPLLYSLLGSTHALLDVVPLYFCYNGSLWTNHK